MMIILPPIASRLKDPEGGAAQGTTVHFEKTLEWLPGAAGRHLLDADGGS